MISRLPPNPSLAPAGPRATLEEARIAWQRGDVRGCLLVLGALEMPRHDGARAAFVLLRARALIRTGQPAAARDGLRSMLASMPAGDLHASALTLYGAAVGSVSSPERGLLLIERAREASSHSHIRAEADYFRGMVLRRAKRPEEAESAAVAGAIAGADIVSARCVALRGWLAIDRGEYRAALDFLDAAERAVAESREPDGYLAATIQSAIARLELELRRDVFTGRHRERYRADVEAGATIASTTAPVPRLLGRVADAWAFALDGDVTCAIDRVWEAMRFAEAAGSDGWRVYALAERAAILRAVREIGASRKAAEEAWDAAEHVRWSETAAEERVALLLLAGETARFDNARGHALLARHRALQRDTPARGRASSAAEHLRTAARDDFIAGIVARESGSPEHARKLLRRALKAYRALGIEWREAWTLVELAALRQFGGGAEAASAATALTARHFPGSFLEVSLPTAQDAIRSSLPQALGAILDLLCAEKSIEEIATLRKRSVATIRTQVRELRRRYNVRTQRALVARCARPVAEDTTFER